MKAWRTHLATKMAKPWVTFALCVAVMAAGALALLIRNRLTYAENFAPDWLPLVAGGLAAAGTMMRLSGYLRSPRLRTALTWGGLLLMVWAANGLPIDVLRLVRLIPLGVDWPGMGTRTLALGAALVLARQALANPAASASGRSVAWYGYAAFVLALPYPVIRTSWALGGTLGLMWPGAAGQGFAPWLASIPWLLAAALSLLLVSTRSWVPHRLLLIIGWSATAVVAMIGPAACWALVTKSVGGDTGLQGIASWVPCVFYGSWFLWSIAAGAATRSYQIRGATVRMASPRRSSA